MKPFHQAGNHTDVSDVESEGSGTWQEPHSICTPASSHAGVAPWTWAEVPSSCHHLCGEGVKREEWNVRHLATGTCVSLETWKAFYWDAREVSVQTGMSVPPLWWVSILLLPSPHSKPLWRRRKRVSADVTGLKSAGRSVNAKDSKSKTVNHVIRKPEVTAEVTISFAGLILWEHSGKLHESWNLVTLLAVSSYVILYMVMDAIINTFIFVLI